MPYILEHLTSLRQEITDLRNMNARSAAKSADSQIDQSAVEMRANRLVEIKKELSQMLNRPEDPAVWWKRVAGGVAWLNRRYARNFVVAFIGPRSGEGLCFCVGQSY